MSRKETTRLYAGETIVKLEKTELVKDAGA
jgi:hypothetical protein